MIKKLHLNSIGLRTWDHQYLNYLSLISLFFWKKTCPSFQSLNFFVLSPATRSTYCSWSHPTAASRHTSLTRKKKEICLPLQFSWIVIKHVAKSFHQRNNSCSSTFSDKGFFIRVLLCISRPV
ncbi:hypothetical protein LWI29_005520 [Acer saccharum]|uniref:Uncharacterized protein n=1 Tax=Acer saccharum TaxID=4024 RepID=A0AA39S7V1_ACESA|nr:hypothetical protein LWI29_005520 [Acer saccharum]